MSRESAGPARTATARDFTKPSAELPIEQFAALNAIDICRHGFIKRVPGIDVSHDKLEALNRLDHVHREARTSLEIGTWPLITAQQVHGNKVVVVDHAIDADKHFADCDGFVTNQREVALGIYVADCCAVYIVDAKTPAIGLVHSGRKGSELNIAGRALDLMREKFGSNFGDIIVQLSPCIRPPHYEIDFAAQVREQCRERGVDKIYDNGTCTACDLESYYSYRAEKGKTGRMLALLGLR
jgi:copper oxidase (laccase) domain-containing protein